MIHVIKYDHQSKIANLYNTDTDEIKTIHISNLKLLVDKGLEIANELELVSIIRDRKEYRYFFRKKLNGSDIELAEIQNPSNVKIVSRYNTDTSDIVNGMSYEIAVATKDNLGELVNNQSFGSCQGSLRGLRLSYASYIGDSYETSLSDFKSVDKEMSGFLDGAGVFSEFDSFGYDKDFEFATTCDFSAEELMETVINIPEGTMVFDSTKTKLDGEIMTGKKLVFPESCFSSYINLKGRLTELDFSKSSVVKPVIYTDFYDSNRIEKVILSDKSVALSGIIDLDSFGHSEKQALFLDTGQQILLGASPIMALFVPKSVKAIGTHGCIAETVMLEEGIDLEFIGKNGIIAGQLLNGTREDFDNLVVRESPLVSHIENVRLGSHTKLLSDSVRTLSMGAEKRLSQYSRKPFWSYYKSNKFRIHTDDTSVVIQT